MKTTDSNANKHGSTEVRSCALFGVIRLRSNPCVEVKGGAVRKGCESTDAVMAVKNSIAIYLKHQHARGRDLSVSADMLLDQLKPTFGF